MPKHTRVAPANDLLFAVSEATSGLTGKDYVLELTKKITEILDMDYCFVVECANKDKTRLRSIAFVHGQKVLDNIEYNTDESACSMMMNGEPYFLSNGAKYLFPAAKTLNIEAYVGAPILSPVTGETLGHIAALNLEAVGEEKNQTAVLKIFAAKLGAELERMKTEKELRGKNRELNEQIRDNEFYAFTMNNLMEAVFWLDHNGSIWQVNDVAAKISGYTKEELRTMQVFDISLTAVKAAWPSIWSNLKDKKKMIVDTKLKCKDGSIIDVEITKNFLSYEGREYSCSIARDIRKRKSEEELLRNVSEATSGLTGACFIIELAKNITRTLGMQYAVITECANAERTRLRMLCSIDGENVLENEIYDPEGTPCGIIAETGKDFFMPEGVQKIFPKKNGIESAIGVPILSSKTGEMIGHIIVVDSSPMPAEKDLTSVLKIFATRAGAEMERMKAEKELAKTNEELTKRIKEVEALKNQLQMENKYLQEEIRLTSNFEEIISRSKDFQRVLQKIQQVASTDTTVLILGESGTGKELIARAVHNISNRSKRPLVKVSCATLPANLIESELFGYEKGAFTGALERKIGRFELADGGSIFLDEIGELPVELQAKLLRVLQEGEFERLGNPKTLKVNVRVIAATNRNLQLAIERREFRDDLYYRLNVFPIICPPLRDRKEDIPLLVKHFCQKHEGKIGRKITAIPPKVMDALLAYDWPGNIRELENIIERAMVLSENGTLEFGDWIPQEKIATNGSHAMPQSKLVDVEKEHIIEILKQTGWKVSGEKGAAKILGLNPTTLEARMKKMGIKRQDANNNGH